MSEEESVEDIPAAIESALNDILTRAGGGFVTAFIAAAAVIDEDGDHAILVTSPETQPVTATLGLSEFLRESARAAANLVIYGSEGDDA